MSRVGEKKTELGKSRSAIVFAAVSVSFLLAVYAPLENYFTNKNEFWFDFYGIIGIFLGVFFCLAVLLILGLAAVRRIRAGGYRVAFTLVQVLYFEFWIEGTFLAGHLPMLDGKEIEWDSYPVWRFLSVLVFVVLLLLAVGVIKRIGFQKMERYAGYLDLFLAGTLFLTLVSLAVIHNGLERKERLLLTKDHEYEYSTDQNMIILLLDAVDADEFDLFLETHPEYGESLRDFTYYEDMLSTYTQTAYSVPYIMTGQWYEDDKEEYETYLKKAYDESPLLDSLQSRGFRVGMYITEFVPAGSDRVYSFENVRRGKSYDVDVVNFLKIEAKVVAFRYAPYDLKRFCTYTRDYMLSQKGLERDHIYFDLNDDFYADLQKEEIVYTEDKMFKYLHLEGAHPPFVHNPDVSVTEYGNYEMSMEATFRIVDTYLNKLKEAGVYDNSAVVIMADHGFSKEDVPEDRLHPVFFVKGIGETGDRMRVSKAPVSFEDLGVAFERLMDGVDGAGIFDWREGDSRDRRCYFFSYPELMHNVECIAHGYAGDIETLEILR